MISKKKKKGRFKKGLYFSSKLNKEILYRSSWEEKFYRCLDSDVNVIFYDVESIIIKYKYGKKYRNYYPDIYIKYLDNKEKLVEIKPQSYLLKRINVAKFKAAIEFCGQNNMKFEVWTESKNPYLSRKELLKKS